MRFNKENSLTVLAVDIGTSGCRATICAQDGSVLSNAERSYGVNYYDNGFAEQDPDLIFSAFIQVIKQCTAEFHVSVDYVAIGSVLHSLLLLDVEGNPLTPLSVWADTRAIDQCQRLRGTFELNRWHVRTGCPLSPTYPIYRLLWYRENSPELFRKYYKAVSIKSYIHYRLFGLYLEDHSVASGSGMFNIQAREWDREVLDILGIDNSKLPKVVPVEYQVPVSRSFITQNLSGITKWIVGGADGPLAHLGTASRSQNVASLTIGTSGAVRVKVGMPQIPKNNSLWCYVLNNNSFVTGLATNNGGNVVDWFVKLLYPEVVDWKYLEEAIVFSVPDPELFFIPFINKERANYRNILKNGQFLGLKQIHTRDDLLKAVIEGVVFNVVSLFYEMKANYSDIKAVALSGTLTRLGFVTKLVNKIVNLPIINLGTDNASLLGLAKLTFLSDVDDFDDNIWQDVMTDEFSTLSTSNNNMFKTVNYIDKFNCWKRLAFP
jgi:gluconokinase